MNARPSAPCDLARLLAVGYRRSRQISKNLATPDVSASCGHTKSAAALDVHGEESAHVLRRTGPCQTA